MPRVNAVPVIAIDGPSGSGKGTVSRKVAQALGWQLLDSGALYRLVGLAADEAGLDPADEPAHAALARGMQVRFATDPAGEEAVWLGDQQVSSRLRSEQASATFASRRVWSPTGGTWARRSSPMRWSKCS